VSTFTVEVEKRAAMSLSIPSEKSPVIPEGQKHRSVLVPDKRYLSNAFMKD
jgi:hypothetical protein